MIQPCHSDVTQLLERLEGNEDATAQELLPLVYAELRMLAASRMSKERGDHTLQATALVHEAYIRVVGDTCDRPFHSSAHFFAAAAEAMRRILIDHARKKGTLKRGGEFQRVDLSLCEADSECALTPDQFLDLDEALQKMKSEDPLVAELVSLRLYTGLSVTEAAKAIGISRTVGYEYWDYALAWFNLEFGDSPCSVA